MKINSRDFVSKFFTSLSEETGKTLTGVLQTRCFKPGEIIQIEGEECQWVGFVVKGAIRIFKSAPNGREQVLTNLGPGMHFNAIPAITSPHTLKASARSITDTSIFTLSVEEYRHLMQTRADFAFVVARDFAYRLDHLTGLVEDLSLRSVRGRLARFLLDQADEGELSPSWTQDEIAARLGTVRDVIGRTLRGFMDAGLIRRNGSRLLLIDRSRLEEEVSYSEK